MPIANQGVVPASGATYTELTSIVRRAFVPKLFVQMYFASPSLFYLFGNAQRAAGGLSQITIPAQGGSMVQGQFTGYGGGFNAPVVTPGIQNFQFPLAYWVVPIPLPFGETILQSTEAVIPLLKARMNDAYAVTRQNMASLLFTLNTANTLKPNSFIDAFDNGTLSPTYGGISRVAAGNSAFQGQYINLAITPWSLGTVGFTRRSMSSFIIKITDVAGGEAPTCGIMSPGDFSTLNADFIGAEQVRIPPGNEYAMGTPVRSSFPNLTVAGIPLFADHFCPAGTVIFPNMKYSNMYIDENAALDFSGFYSLVPVNQLAQQGLMVLGYNFVSAKPSSGAQGYGLGGAAFT